MRVLLSSRTSGMDLDHAHFQTLLCLLLYGRMYEVTGGSFVGHKRLELEFFELDIRQPWVRPLTPMIPPGIPWDLTDEKITNYAGRYLLSDIKSENESYTYGEYITKQLDQVVDMLSKYGRGTNQAVITIGDADSINQADPPCLRTIQFRVIDDQLHMIVYFRSWDAWSGLPENLGGLQLLKEVICSRTGFRDGSIKAVSAGVHIYDIEWPYVAERFNKTFPEGSVLTLERALAGYTGR